MAFREHEHPRTARGNFKDKTFGVPEINLYLEGADVLEYVDRQPHVTSRPSSQLDLVANLNAAEGQGGKHRLVRVRESLFSLSGCPVYGPTDGTSLLIDVEAMNGTLEVLGGDVVIRNASRYPLDITVHNDANVTVIMAEGRSSMIAANDEANVLVLTGPDARGVLKITDERADGAVIGQSHIFHTARTYAWRM